MSTFLKQPRAWLTLLLVVFAVWLRFRLPGYSEMWVDQSVTLSMAHAWVRGGPFPLHSGMSSAGLQNPPLLAYLYAIPLAFSADPLWVVWWIGLVNLAGIFIAGWATARVFGWRAAWWATLLFVVNPQTLSFARLIWMPSFVPGFAAMLYACVLLYVADEPKPRYLLLGALCFSAVVQNQPTAAPLLAALILLALCFRHRMNWRVLALSGVVFILTFTPYLVYQFQSRFADLAVMRTRLSDFEAFNFSSVLLVIDMLHSVGVFSSLGSAADLWRSRDPLWYPGDNLLTGLFVLSVAMAVLLALRLRREHSPRAAGALTLLVWLGVPPLFYIYHQHYLYTYYFFSLVPVLFPLLALLCDQLADWLAPWFRNRGRDARLALAAFLPLAFVAFQQTQTMVIGENLSAQGVSGHRRVIDVRRAIIQARELLAAQPDCQLVILEADPFYDFREIMGEFTDRARTRFAEVGQSYLYPDPCAVYLSTTDRAEVTTWLQRVAQPLPASTIRTPEETWTFYALSPEARAAAVADLMTETPLGVWANGAQLQRFEWSPAPDGDSLELAYTWAIGSLPSEATRSRLLTVGNYLLDSTGVLVSQIDGPGRDSRDWRTGDIFRVNWQLPLPADLPPGEYSIATAFYFYPELQRIPLADGEGDMLIVQKVKLPVR